MQILRSSLPPFAHFFLRLTSLLVWAVVAYSAVVFALQWGGGVPVDAVVAGSEQKQVSPDVDSLSASKALGAAPVQSASASLASRFVLVGVMDGGPSQGVALISVDGKPAKPYRLGQTVSDGLVVVGTGPKKAELGPQMGVTSSLVLELPIKK
ncbi:MAG: general secretion pathway protein C [Burkholderiales bacterium]|nr:general secretion pathway protein C [Burkholderiales bacterium]